MEEKEINKPELPGGNMTSKKHSVIRNIVLVGVGLLGALLCLELMLRAYYFLGDKQLFGIKPSRTTLHFYENETIGHAFEPNQRGWFVTLTHEYFTDVEINSQGWPDVEHTIEKPNDTYRILILGDSFVENIQVPLEKRFFRQLERSLNESHFAEKFGKQKVEIIALGRGNTGTNQQYLMLRDFGLKYSPDLVIQAFLTANDIKNNSFELENDPYLPFFELNDNQLIELPHQKRSERPYAAIKDDIKHIRLVEILLILRQTYRERNYANLIDYPIDYHVYDTEYNERYKYAWEVTQALLMKTKQLTEESGSRYMLVTLANNEQVNKDVWESLLETYPSMNNSQLVIDKPDMLIHTFCEKHNFECYFMLPYFQEFVSQNTNSSTHYRFDGHWNETGTNLAAEYLLNILTRDFSTQNYVNHNGIN